MNRAAILMYHIVDRPRSEREAKYCCPPEVFEQHMGHLSASGRAVGLPELVAALQGEGDCPADAVAVTFDDGFAATFENAMSVLERHRVPATMFLVSGRIGSHNDWMTANGFPRRDLVTRAQVLAMRDAGVTLGSHTRTHPRLTAVSAPRLADEIAGSKADLEDVLGREVGYFAYPFGLLDETARAAVERAGYRAACSTRSGFNGTQVGHFELRRIEVFGWDSVWRLRQKLKFGRNDASLTYPLQYYAGRLRARLGL
jgi:peptidoglycan/xylan/chitin deacetylase (PgdA/CDA1 family)